EQPELVEQVLGEQEPDQGGASSYRDVLARLPLELGQGGGDVAADHAGRPPVGVCQRGRDDDLGGGGHHPGVRRGGRAGEHAAEQFVGAPSVQVRASGGQQRHHVLVQLVVVVRR